MKNIYVFFYNQDKPPLMLFYDKNWFVPIDRDEYFEMWKHENTLGDKKPCIGNYDMIKTHLDLTNRKLNRIELTHDMSSKTSSTYGIPPPNNPPNKPEINLERVQVTKIPSKPTDNRPYVKLVHRTSNSFSIGDIYYDGQDITNGVTINCSPSVSGSDKITVDTNEDGKNSHTQFVLYNTPNTVVAYYHKDDNTYKLPQLIVLLETQQAIRGDTDPITAKESSKYGYYVLATNNGGGYKYEWRAVEEQPSKPLTLDDETEFRLLNAIVIMVDKTTQYDEGVISGAVKSTGIKSPGNTENDVNRLKQKMINVPEQTGASAERYGNPGKCISKYGYRLWAHDITALVTWTGSSGQPSIPLIGGFRFLIPSSENATGYQEINLYKDDTAKEPAERLYHSPTGDQNRKNKVYVFFYNKDPRPLLMCYGGNAYIPQKLNEPISYKQVDVDYKKWIRERKITDCVCLDPRTADNDGNILDALLNVVLFLNPVQINPTKIPSPISSVITAELPKPSGETSKNITYNLHKFTATQTVKMKITRTDICCYEQYKYEPAGTNGDKGDGFRLGTVFYTSVGGDKPTATLKYYELSPSSKYNPLIKVIVYYYGHDKKYQEPLLIELEFNTNGGVNHSANPKEYFQLKTLINSGGTGMSWAKDEDAVGKLSDDSDNKKLVSYLDKIRYLFKNVLQVRIAIKKIQSYDAKLLDKTGHPVESENDIQITVTEEDRCPSLSDTGFRCFKHKISTLESNQLHKFAALEFYIPSASKTQVKLNLYNNVRTGPISPLYYNCGMGDICVYFYGKGSSSSNTDIQNDGDPRPLILIYNKKVYIPSSLDEYFKKWVIDDLVDKNDCNGSNKRILVTLVYVSNFLNPLNIKRRPVCPDSFGIYKIHGFNGNDINIRVESKLSRGTFCYHKYTHTHDGIGNKGVGFRLGNITYGSECIFNKNDFYNCINSVLDDPLDKYTPASEVVVYYYQGDPNHQNPLLVALCKKANGDALNGSSNVCTYKPYYELQRDSTDKRKIYRKQDNQPIVLDDNKGSDLEKILDRILYYISKSILIDLSFRVTKTEVQYIGKYAERKITIKNAYTARVYKNESESKQVKTSGIAKVNVSGPIELLDGKKIKTGYLCYRHKLSSVKNIEQFGGLRLFLWDNRGSEDNDDAQCKGSKPVSDNKRPCCEIDLHDQSSSKINQIAYTTCKGDLYVYFYGDDPRPLLLCYNGQAYKPSDLISI